MSGFVVQFAERRRREEVTYLLGIESLGGRWSWRGKRHRTTATLCFSPQTRFQCRLTPLPCCRRQSSGSRMSRSVELGRAVLHAPITNHELWLTTFITISPEQTSTYLAQLTPVQCLEELASGALWVHRGHDMHMDLKLTLHNEALPHKQFQALTNAILQAPVSQTRIMFDCC
jgi:hypothetical protein